MTSCSNAVCGSARDIYECECPLEPGEQRTLYVVTGHDGREDFARYCPGCYELAEMDWNGETAAIRIAGAPEGSDR